MKKEMWKKIVKIVITVITAVGSIILGESCGVLH